MTNTFDLVAQHAVRHRCKSVSAHANMDQCNNDISNKSDNPFKDAREKTENYVNCKILQMPMYSKFSMMRNSDQNHRL